MTNINEILKIKSISVDPNCSSFLERWSHLPWSWNTTSVRYTNIVIGLKIQEVVVTQTGTVLLTFLTRKKAIKLSQWAISSLIVWSGNDRRKEESRLYSTPWFGMLEEPLWRHSSWSSVYSNSKGTNTASFSKFTTVGQVQEGKKRQHKASKFSH